MGSGRESGKTARPGAVTGKAPRLDERALGGVQPAPTPRRFGYDAARQLTLQGRSGEVDRLGKTVAQLEAGQARLLLIEGEAGIGKTALLKVARRMLEEGNVQVLYAEADELGGRRPLSLVGQLFGDELDCPTSVVGEAGHAADLAFRTSDLALDIVDKRCMSGPVAILVEDLHWFDPASVFVLRRLIRHASALSLAVLGTLRPLPRGSEVGALVAEAGPAGILPVGALSSGAMWHLAQEVLDGPPSRRLAARLDAAGGNPLFALEIVDALAADGALHRLANGRIEMDHDVDLGTLSRAVLHRLNFLSPETLHVLAVAAVLGTRFNASSLSDLSGLPPAELVRPLREAVRSGILAEQANDLAFRHEIIRASLYDDIPASVRTALHRDAARLLVASGAPAGAWAEHMLRGTQDDDPSAVADLRRAAAELMETLPHSAVEFLDRAIELAGPASPDRPDIERERAIALLWSGKAAEGEAGLRLAISLSPDGQAKAELLRGLTQSLLWRGDVGGVLQEAASGLADPSLPSEGRAWLHALRAMALHFAGATTEGWAAADAASEGSDPALKVLVCVARSLLSASEGRHEEAWDNARAALLGAEESPSRLVFEPVPHITAAMPLIDLDRFDEAAAIVERGREVQEHYGRREKLVVHHVALGYALFWSGAWDAAEAEFETGISLALEVGAGWRAAARGLRAVIAACRGDLHQAG